MPFLTLRSLVAAMIRLATGAIAVGTCLLVLVIYEPVHFFAYVVTGRSALCSYEEARKSHENEQEAAAATMRATRSCRLLTEDSDGFQLWETPQGNFWIPGGSNVLMLLVGEQERNIYGGPASGIQAGDVVLDCGAHVGVYTRAALAAGARGVIAIEPAPENLECLRRNLVDEIETGSVVVYDKGVWNEDSFLELRIHNRNSGRDSFVMEWDEAEETIEVPVTTIDNLVRELDLKDVDIIKMDIEGAEVPALEGAHETIRKFRPRLAIAAYHLGGDALRISHLVQDLDVGFQMRCGPCREYPFLRIAPEVLHFVAAGSEVHEIAVLP